MTLSLAHLTVAMLAFLATHAIPARPGLRDSGIARFGNVGYHLLYSLLSIAVVVWLAYAYAHADYVAVWGQQLWMRWVPPLAMIPACLLLVAGLSTPNPFSIGIGGRGFDANHPGILRLTRHPLLWAMVLWAGAHIVPNGDVASLILFVPLLLLALAGPFLMERKRRRTIGRDFDALARNTSHPNRALFTEIGWLRGAGALALYVVLILLHPWVIGVSPLPH